MNYNKLETEIVSALNNSLQYVSAQPYWKEINSFCLYTDESYMSLTLVFNTSVFLATKESEKFYLTYKYSPAEWVSERLNDKEIRNNSFFAAIAKQLRDYVLSGVADNNHGDALISACVAAMNEWIKNNNLDTSKYFFSVMISDCCEKEDIVKMNQDITNSNKNKKEFLLWCETEL